MTSQITFIKLCRHLRGIQAVVHRGEQLIVSLRRCFNPNGAQRLVDVCFWPAIDKLGPSLLTR